jgi:hypothetical protein
LIDPYVGLSRNFFYVANEKELNKEYAIPSVTGVTGGLKLKINRYFHSPIDELYWTPFVNLGYSFVDYKKVNEKLGTGYFEWTIGATYIAFF